MQPKNPLKQILLIDDDADFCQLLTDVLDGSNCHLIAIRDPHEGLRFALTSTHLDLILLDIDMPELSGIEILAQLQRTRLREVPVIMLTAHSEIQTVQDALKQGAYAYLLKPFRLNQFVEMLNELFQEDIFTSLLQAKSPNPFTQDASKTHQILVVDDEAQIHFMIQETLEKSVVDVLSFRTARDALKQIEKKNPDLVLLDMHMPEMDGIEVLQKLRELAPDLPVLFLTSDSDEHKVEEARKYNIQGYILKPYKYHFFVSELEKALGTFLFPGKR